ncbi:chitinase jessie 2 [Echinococcus multilocularis]|uniref:Chitinase jessie 2 n=1 Tax=Echinococcus multilocularis TaxID=6211 RepID=A0A0S4MNQ4_ECHMU|nr:chitinase jessie 2 [Echinococcus multilocularis]
MALRAHQTDVKFSHAEETPSTHTIHIIQVEAESHSRPLSRLWRATLSSPSSSSPSPPPSAPHSLGTNTSSLCMECVRVVWSEEVQACECVSVSANLECQCLQQAFSDCAEVVVTVTCAECSVQPQNGRFVDPPSAPDGAHVVFQTCDAYWDGGMMDKSIELVQETKEGQCGPCLVVASSMTLCNV